VYLVWLAEVVHVLVVGVDVGVRQRIEVVAWHDKFDVHPRPVADPKDARNGCFGKPDIDIRPAAGADGQLQVEIHGLDVYDPTTGVVRSDSTDVIACWFIDTAYDDAQFFVRHAYFLGADDPYDKLKRALRADIDEAAWASLNSTVSRPFARPVSGRIAVKVINHYGDEILKVYGV
jgi:adenine-specific DNA-methyltransferase